MATDLLNKVSTVTKIFPDKVSVVFEGGTGYWDYLPEWLEHVHKFEVGDKVICQKIPTVRSPSDPYFSDAMKTELLQQVGVVKDVYSKTVNVNFPHILSPSKWSYLPEWLEHAPEEEVTETTPEEPVFKVGDKVICRKKPDDPTSHPVFVPSMENFLNKVGTVKECAIGRNCVTVSFEGSLGWDYLSEWLEHYVEVKEKPKSEILSIATKPEIKERLKEIAKKQDKSVSKLVTETLEGLVLAHDNPRETIVVPEGSGGVRVEMTEIPEKPKSSNILSSIWKKVWGTLT